MEYEPIDSSGTDDDFPPLCHHRVPLAGHVTENGRSLVSATSFSRMRTDMEYQIHYLEQEAYGAVLRAFKAQSDALTWEKEGLITELRKELRVSDDEHRELLNKVNADDIICRIREWRKVSANHGILLGNAQPINDELPSPTVSASHKRRKPSQPPMGYGMTSQSLHAQSISVTMQPLLPPTNFGSSIGAVVDKPRPGQLIPGSISMNPTEFRHANRSPRGRLNIHGASRTQSMNEPGDTATCDTLIGRKVMIRWPADNNFYEASIADFNPTEGRHALVYDRNTRNETWEWVTLKEIPLEDIRWVDVTPGVLQQGGGMENSMNHEMDPDIGRGRELSEEQHENNKLASPQNLITNKSSLEFEILHTETLLGEVEKMFDASHIDLLQIEKAKKMLKEHEQSLVEVIAKIADVSDSESDRGPQVSRGPTAAGEHG